MSRRIQTPYGEPIESIFDTDFRKETKTYQEERFGEPYRSRTKSVYNEERRGFERRGERTGGERTARGRGSGSSSGSDERDQRGYGRRSDRGERTWGDRTWGDRTWGDRSRTGERPRTYTERKYGEMTGERSRKYNTKPSYFEKEEDENFENLSSQVVIPQEDLQTIRNEMNALIHHPFTIVEAVVNPSHESSIFLAKGKNVERLFTFIGKNDPELIKELENQKNISIIEDSFVFTPPEVKNPFVLFFYPYWLMNMDPKSAQNKGYFKNIPLHSGTFDDILRIEQPDYFVFVIPKEVYVPPEYGKITEIELSKGKMVIIQTTKQSRVPMFGKSTGKKEYKTEEDWEQNFMKFLKNIMAPIAKEETINKIVNSKTLPMWKKAFTHETIDLNDNYEQLETIGDRVLELVFLKYLLRKFPDLTPQEITELKSKYMSKIYQGTTSRKLGFGDWIRVGNDISSISILEDVFESFFGALFEISDMEIGDGVGYVMALKFLTMIFTDVTFDLSKAQGHPRSQIKEILEMLRFDPEITEAIPSEKGTNVTIRISDETHNDLVELGMMDKNSSNIIGVGFGPYKTNAVNLAYSNALEYLESLGITRKWAENQKELAELLIPELEPYLDRALKRMEDEGYSQIFLRTSRTSAKAGSVVVQLVGVYFDQEKNKEQRKILISGKYSQDSMKYVKMDIIQDGKIDVVRRYAEGK
jgi:dsRNA-specific ribonuclease